MKVLVKKLWKFIYTYKCNMIKDMKRTVKKIKKTSRRNIKIQ